MEHAFQLLKLKAESHTTPSSPKPLENILELVHSVIVHRLIVLVFRKKEIHAQASKLPIVMLPFFLSFSGLVV